MATLKGSIKSDRLNANLSTKRVTVNIGGGGTIANPDHAQLINLDFPNSGHIGFAGIEFGTTTEWNAKIGYRPVKGMLVVYTDYQTIMDPDTGEEIQCAGIKIGNGNAYLQDLSFLGKEALIGLEEHIRNTEVHIQPGEREFWNNKINYNEPQEKGDLLEFTRN